MNLVWSLRWFGGYRAGEDVLVIRDREISAVDQVPMIWCHGFLGTAASSRQAAVFDDLAAVAALGYPVFCGDLFSGNTWGIDEVVDASGAIDDLISWAGTTFGCRTDKVIVAGESMGTVDGFNWAWRNADKVAAAWFRGPFTDLEAFHDRDAGFGALIETAYGSEAAYEAALPTHDPAQNLGELTELADRTWLWYALSDELIPAAEVESFADATGVPVKSIAGMHAALQGTPVDVVAAWIHRTVLANS